MLLKIYWVFFGSLRKRDIRWNPKKKKVLNKNVIYSISYPKYIIIPQEYLNLKIISFQLHKMDIYF